MPDDTVQDHQFEVFGVYVVIAAPQAESMKRAQRRRAVSRLGQGAISALSMTWRRCSCSGVRRRGFGRRRLDPRSKPGGCRVLAGVILGHRPTADEEVIGESEHQLTTVELQADSAVMLPRAADPQRAQAPRASLLSWSPSPEWHRR